MKIPKSNGVIIYDYLLAFYFKWYSAHLMYLAVYSKGINKIYYLLILFNFNIINCNFIYRGFRLFRKISSIYIWKNRKKICKYANME